MAGARVSVKSVSDGLSWLGSLLSIKVGTMEGIVVIA
jgi:hypothetical protein